MCGLLLLARLVTMMIRRGGRLNPLRRVHCLQRRPAARPANNFATAGSSDDVSSTSRAFSNGLLMAVADGLRVVDLDRPERLNCLDPPMLATLLPLLLDWQQLGSDVKLVALRGTSPHAQAFRQAFCGGSNLLFLHDCAAAGDLPRVASATAASNPARLLDAGTADAFLGHLYAVVRAIASGRPPVLALCDGLVLGSGLSLAMHSAMSVATENTLVALPEVGLGGFPAAGVSYALPRLRGPAVVRVSPDSSSALGGGGDGGGSVGLGLGTYIALAGPRLSGRDAVAAGE